LVYFCRDQPGRFNQETNEIEIDWMYDARTIPWTEEKRALRMKWLKRALTAEDYRYAAVTRVKSGAFLRERGELMSDVSGMLAHRPCLSSSDYYENMSAAFFRDGCEYWDEVNDRCLANTADVFAALRSICRE
jgi:hypothetical protein